ncbi:MAG: serine hydrolase [Cyclobacteriaceae bacterium]|nr:serine hydrolase [Cyclobacteriaceae bacterium]
MSHKVFLTFLLSVLVETSLAQAGREKWVDSVFRLLNRHAKVAQLFMVPLPADPSEDNLDDTRDLVKDGVGGVYIMHGGPVRHAAVINKLQSISSRRLLVGAAAEWGLRQSLDSVDGFSKPMVAGALPSDSLVSLWAHGIAQQMKELGVHINFAPNADDQIFAGDYLRYFGGNQIVGRTTSLFVRALQEEGVMAVAKHLPRRWSEERPLPDSMIVLSLDRVDTSSLRPFRQLIAENISGISTDYLHFSIRNEQGIVPASVSLVFIPEILRRMLGFQGLVFADATSIRRKAGKVRPGEAELLAFQAGADVIYNPVDASAGIKKIMREVRRNKLLEVQLEASVKKILAAKYDAGLNHYLPINTDNLVRRMNDPGYQRINDIVSASAVTVIQNRDSLLPIRSLENISMVSISIGKETGNPFDLMLKKYAPVRSISIRNASDTARIQLTNSEVLIVGIFPHAAALERKIQSWINSLAAQHPIIVVHFGNPSSLANYGSANAVIAAFTDEDRMPSVTAQVIFGAIPARGILPVKVGAWSPGTTIVTTPLQRLGFGSPESVGINSRSLSRIRSIMDEAIAIGATPGCYTLVAKDGKVVFAESAGFLTWEKKQPVTDSTLYDLASVTKISATLQTVLFMHDHGLIDINKKASVYLPELKNSNKADFTLKDILTHQAGLWPFLPFWTQTIKDRKLMPEYYSNSYSEDYPYPVAENLFAAKSIKDSLWQWIIKARIRDKPPRTPYDYRYSDMGFYILQHLAEKMLNQPMEDFLGQNLYDPLGAYTTGYQPLRRFPKEQIAPTEQDTLFRKSLLVGYVHDEGAALHGGIAGHAGLFSTANDLAKVGQMWLQKGSYGGITFFKPETIELFSTRQFSDSRRGLGWDKPMPGDWGSPTTRFASAKTFGHTGFTGTCIWVDPEFNLVFIFLSNRVNPNVSNKLLNANIRPRIQQVIYEALFDYRATGK